ncbi:uncharacterized protein LY89DRAFT_722216 [Mollisia scopiformis]|uniref:Uncharacterized protein n=1 Tax=Mollisia scopiformis TaxID=149040 RepID=A0A194WYH8_MOLSC|nr:uncharacterized protein LY89DRAFT_722216 [Mollisia scopiformis]KUJ12662.1 hypothetical protein LY89DRAFT_722216 [Mollisia scopiformis]
MEASISASAAVEQASALASQSIAAVTKSALNAASSASVAIDSLMLMKRKASASSAVLSAQSAAASASASTTAISAPDNQSTPGPTAQKDFVLLTPAQTALIIIGSVLVSSFLTLAISCLILRPRRIAANQVRELHDGNSASQKMIGGKDSLAPKTVGRSAPVASNPIFSHEANDSSPVPRIIDARTGALTPDSFSRATSPDITAEERLPPSQARAISKNSGEKRLQPPLRTRLFIPSSPGSSVSPNRVQRQPYQPSRISRNLDYLDEVLPWEGMEFPEVPDTRERRDNEIRVETDIEVRLRNKDSLETLRMGRAY